MMNSKYKFPLNLFLTFERSTPLVYSSELLTPNHYICIVDKQYFLAMNFFLKKELFYNFNSLIESSAVDTLKYPSFFNSIIINNTQKLLLFYHYYCYSTKLRLTLMVLHAIQDQTNVFSLDLVYKNANWLERETSEMFSTNYQSKWDTRTLLLDYSKKEHPMLKTFQSEGNYELYYDFFDQNLYYSKVRSVEL